MTRILAISSQVACGHIGLSAIIPPIQALGHEVIALPTVVLSNHPGHPHVSGERIAPGKLDDMIAALDSNGWLAGIDVLLTGYLPTADHVKVARSTVERVRMRSPEAQFMCDPVIGDEKEGVYIDRAAAIAIKDDLVPISDIILPNRFELGWLAGTQINSERDAISAARSLPCPAVLATSVPSGDDDELSNVYVADNLANRCRVKAIAGVPKGTGDFLSGIFAAQADLGLAVARTAALAERSVDQKHLAIIQQREAWINAKALPVETIDTGDTGLQ